MYNFLCAGDNDNKKDHLVHWNFVCLPRENGGFDHENLVFNNTSLAGK